MPRYFIDIAYNGVAYKGYQRQRDEPSVQGTIEEKLSLLLKREVLTTGSSRTDAGVHAYQNIAHFESEDNLDVEQIVYKLNKMLPHDIVCNRIFEVEADFHARFQAKSRKYLYRLNYVKDAFSINTSYYFRFGNLDVDLMNQAVRKLFAFEEFDCFCKLHGDNKTTLCQIMEAEWKQVSPGHLEFHVRSNRFLRGMVRGIVGTSILVGRGKITVEEFASIIERKSLQDADFSPPGYGLYLTEIEY